MWKECENQKKNQNSIQNKKEKKKKKGIKRKRIKNAFTWLQACFLGDVGVIWCKSLSHSHFQTYVIDNVEIVFNFYLHITSYVSHTLTSCTHHKQIFVKPCTCDYVLIFVAIQNCLLKCLILFGVWGKNGWGKFLNLDKNWFDWREKVFENIWNH